MFADTELAALDVPEAYQRHQASNAAAAAYERCYTSAVLMRRSSYPDVAAAASFYPLDDLALPCSVLTEHRHPSPSYPVYDRSYVDAPPSSSFLYNAAAAYDCAYVGCPDCVDPGGYSSTPVGGRSSADDEEDDDGASSTPSSSAALRRAPGSLRKRSLSQAELERRRSLANHQERRRMHRLNSALDRLRGAIPPRLQNGSRRLSKIKTLKMAISYIVELQAVLQPAEAAGGRGTSASGARLWN